MAQLLSVPVYKIGSTNTLNSPNPTYIGVAYAQMMEVIALTPPYQTVKGSYVYTIIRTPGTVQNPGLDIYTSLAAATIISGS